MRRSQKRETARGIDPRVRASLELLKEAHPAQLGEIASKLNLSKSRFRHLFKENLGISPKQYVTMIRLEQAKELLENSFLRVKEVAAVVGANDISHFVRAYRMRYGQTPSQTRRLPGAANAGFRQDSRPRQ